MLIEFKVSNYRSIRQEQTLSFVAAGADKKLPGNVLDTSHGRFLKAAALFGANASGKSNMIYALRAMRETVIKSATKSGPGQSISEMIPFRLSEESRSGPCRFASTIKLNDTVYFYEFSATSARIHHESLKVQKLGGRLVPWMERQIENDVSVWSFAGELKSHDQVLREHTRENTLALSRAADLNIEAVKDIYGWFLKSFRVVDHSSQPPYEVFAGRLKTEPKLRERVERIIADADIGIESISIEEVPVHTRLPADMPLVIRNAFKQFHAAISDGAESNQITVQTRHRAIDSDKAVNFDMRDDESKGTQQLFGIAPHIISAIDIGGLLVVDELDASMHPHITAQLIRLFQQNSDKDRPAQIVFSTHDTTLLNLKLLRRDQIYLTEKNNFGETRFFTLWDFPGEKARNSAAIAKKYMEGRLGGVPRLGRTYEDSVI